MYVRSRRWHISPGLDVVNVSNPATPILQGSIRFGGLDEPTAVVVSGSYAFVADLGNAAIRAIDLSTPSAPTQVVVLSLSRRRNYHRSVGHGDSRSYLYVVDSSEFYIVDVQNPAALTVVGNKPHRIGRDL